MVKMKILPEPSAKMAIGTEIIDLSEEERKAFQGTIERLEKEVDGAFEEGYTEGKQAEYDILWDNLQQNGKRVHYSNAFAYTGWNDKNYNPKYPITPTNKSGIGNMFVWNQAITDTKVPITAFGTANSAFSQMASLRRIPKLIFAGATNVTNMFQGCSKLEELYCEGEIDLSINLQWSSFLTAESAKSFIRCLKNFTGTGNEFSCTVTFHDDVWDRLDAEGNSAPDGGSWRNYVGSTLCWSS